MWEARIVQTTPIDSVVKIICPVKEHACLEHVLAVK